VSEPLPPRPPDLPDELPPLDLAPGTLRGFRGGPGVVQGASSAGDDAYDLRLDEVRLADVDLSGCRADGAQLSDVVVERGSWANLRARQATLRRVSCTGLRATGLELAEASVTDAVFEDARLDLSSFRFATVERVAFVDCRLEEADFHGATLTSVRFERCALTRASFDAAAFVRSELRGCELEGLQGVERLRGVRMPFGDVVQLAGLLAAAVGIEIVDQG
jgi:uncharacterized protein YjbI with pentapeptide repeats